MVEHLKKEYKKRTVENEDNLSIKEMYNRLYNVMLDPIEESAKSITQEYEEKLVKLGEKREKEIKSLSNISNEIIESSNFKLDEIGPILAELISLYLGKEYKCEQFIKIHDCYTLIKPLHLSLYKTVIIPENVFVLDKSTGVFKVNQYFLKINENKINYHPLLEKLPFLQEYVDMLIENQVNKLSFDKRELTMRNYEYIFIKAHKTEIEELHNNLKLQEEQELQEKIAKNSSNRAKMLSKLLGEEESSN